MNELVVISGKGGTGKTSLAASFAVLAHAAVVADCDVDAPDLHLILAPQVVEQHQFQSGRTAAVRADQCIRCGACLANCRFDAINMDSTSGAFLIDPIACEGCGVCAMLCPVRAVEMHDSICGAWMISETRCGPMVHAQLRAGAENSGKLVATVRREARRVAEKLGRTQIIIDGPPGIGCPVIASLSNATHVLAVTEPTLSGAHDLERVLSLVRHFRVPVSVCINKWDLNPQITDCIESNARDKGASIAGRIAYSPSVTHAQMQGRAVVETDCPEADEIRAIWRRLYTEDETNEHHSAASLSGHILD